MLNAPSPFGQLPTKVVTYTGEVQNCPKCHKPMNGLTVRDGFMTSEILPHSVRCLHCEPMPIPPKS